MKPFRNLVPVILLLVFWICSPCESSTQEKEKEGKNRNVQAESSPVRRQIKSQYVAETKWRWITNWFLLGGGVAYDSDGGTWGTTQVSWTPTLIFNDSLRFKINLGVSGMNLFTTGTFVGLDGVGSFVFSGARPLLFEVGAGTQYWSNKEGFLPQVRGGIGYRFSGQGNLFHAIQVTYSRLFNDLLRINMVVASLALRF